MIDSPRFRLTFVAIPALALVLAALIAAFGLIASKRADRFVTVKGVAELDAEANLVLWPVPIATTSNDLAAAQRSLDDNLTEVLAFLGEFGIDSAAISRQGTQVTDRAAERFGSLEQGQMRYIVSATLSVRS